MRKYLFLLALLYASQCVYAQNTVYIAINNSECSNCLNQSAYLRQLDPGFKKVLIFPQGYQKDSAFVLQRLSLDSFTQNIVWSDSMYQAFRNNSGGYESAVSLYNNESGKMMKVVLVNLPAIIGYFNSMNQQTDTLSFPGRPLGRETELEIHDGYFYLFDGLRKEMRVFSRWDNKALYTLRLTDSLTKEAFKLKYGKDWKEKRESATAYCKRIHKIDANIYSNYFCSGDTTYLLGKHSDLYTRRYGDSVDTFLMPFLTLSTYKGDRLLDFSLVENYVGPEFQPPNLGISRAYLGKGYENAYYILSGEFLVYRNIPYFAVLGDLAPGKKNHFLARYQKSGPHQFVFDTLFDRNLPDIYTRNYGYTYLLSGYIPASLPYLALYGSDHLFSLDENVPDIDMNYFDDSLFLIKKGIWDLKVSREYAYMIIMDKVKQKYCYLKYDLYRKKPLIYKAICDYKSPKFVTTPKIDDFDYNYAFVPVTDSTILRVRMNNPKN